jgi:hypothetical protein
VSFGFEFGLLALKGTKLLTSAKAKLSSGDENALLAPFMDSTLNSTRQNLFPLISSAFDTTRAKEFVSEKVIVVDSQYSALAPTFPVYWAQSSSSSPGRS